MGTYHSAYMNCSIALRSTHLELRYSVLQAAQGVGGNEAKQARAGDLYRLAYSGKAVPSAPYSINVWAGTVLNGGGFAA